MNRFTQFVTHQRKIVLSIFLSLATVSLVLIPFVSVNYNMVDYLPKDAPSTAAIRIMEEEFGGDLPNARVMVSSVTVREALDYKEKIAALEGVKSVTWLDDVVGSDVLRTTPSGFIDPAILKNYYKDDDALFSVSIENGKETAAVDAIQKLGGDRIASAGEAVDAAVSQSMAVTEVLNAMAILIPVILAILILSTTSWIEPLLFLAAIGIAVVVNMGTNVLFGEVSFITQTVSPILQLAVSLDYAIFLLHSFHDFRLSHEPREAMRLALKQAFPTVAASAATTVIGFSALIAMRFGIGSDLGVNLLKGILLSFLSVMVFLPALTLAGYRLIDKTQHRSFFPSFKKVGRAIMKIRIPLLAIALIAAIPCFLAQSDNNFLYGMGGMAQNSSAGQAAARIEEKFGKENVLVLMVPRENSGKEAKLCDKLSEVPHVTSVVSFTTAVGSQIPSQFVPEEALKQFYSEHYARILLYTDHPQEGDLAFQTVESVKEKAESAYGTYFLAGQSATLFDMKNVVSTDTAVVNLIAVIGIFLVLLLTFRSVSIPALLVFVIEIAIWINLSFPYFAGNSLNFIGYLVISTVQLGATVDYAILLTNRYLADREGRTPKEAILKSLSDNLPAIFISAAILATAGFTLSATARNPIVSELGMLLGRGTALSFLTVAGVLPALLVIFDKLIKKTTLRKDFHLFQRKRDKSSST